MEDYCCEQCKKLFKDGEVVAVSEDNFYHGFIGHRKEMSCVKNYSAINGNKVIYGQKGIFYRGKLFNNKNLDILKEIDIELNELRNGDKIRGDLSSLGALVYS